jgi:LCP family protein required for cell wall assembly
MVGVVLALLGGGTAFGAQLLVHRWGRAVDQDTLVAPNAREAHEPRSTPATSPPSPTPSPTPSVRRTSVEGPLTYLVIGTDQQDTGGRADAIIIAHIAADLREAYLISIPRDLLVSIPGYWDDKINAAYQFGGAQLLSTTLNDLTGIGFDGAAIIDFGGFQEVVDAIGGVEICLDQPVPSIHSGTVFPAGCQHLNGAQALDLARQRYDLPDGDFDRGRHHQQLIQAMVDQAASSDLLTDPIRLDRTMRAIGDALTVDTGGVPLPDLAFALRHLRTDRITGITLPSYPEIIDGTSYVVAESAASDLYRAVRESELAAWVSANGRWRND